MRKISVSVIALLLIVMAQLDVFDDIGKRYTDASFKRALVTFGVARGLNGVISVAQGTEVAMEPAGIGVVFAPGQILDPVNDLIERFSWVMLASTTSIGIQGLLLKIFSSPVFTLLVAVAVAGALLLLWWPRLPDVWRKRVYRITAVLLILRFLIPAMAISGEGFYRLFLASDFHASSAHLSQTKETLGHLSENTRHADRAVDHLSWYDGLRRNIQKSLAAMNVDEYVAALQRAVENLTEHTINLIVVFTLQTILFPLFFYGWQ
jgi:hypothetical protein